MSEAGIAWRVGPQGVDDLGVAQTPTSRAVPHQAVPHHAVPHQAMTRMALTRQALARQADTAGPELRSRLFATVTACPAAQLGQAQCLDVARRPEGMP